jgi:hypothetical protein
VTVGGVLSESWHLYTRFFRRFFLVAVIVFLVVNLVNAALGAPSAPEPASWSSSR